MSLWVTHFQVGITIGWCSSSLFVLLQRTIYLLCVHEEKEKKLRNFSYLDSCTIAIDSAVYLKKRFNCSLPRSSLTTRHFDRRELPTCSSTPHEWINSGCAKRNRRNVCERGQWVKYIKIPRAADFVTETARRTNGRLRNMSVIYINNMKWNGCCSGKLLHVQLQQRVI